jgi:hypothetical protein
VQREYEPLLKHPFPSLAGVSQSQPEMGTSQIKDFDAYGMRPLDIGQMLVTAMTWENLKVGGRPESRPPDPSVVWWRPGCFFGCPARPNWRACRTLPLHTPRPWRRRTAR